MKAFNFKNILFSLFLLSLMACGGKEEEKEQTNQKNQEQASNQEKPIQHLKVDDLKSYDEAKKVFHETTNKLKTKKTLSPEELHEIHMITYSLEKAIAYFVTHLNEQKSAAEKMAVVVEEIHLSSENNRKADCEKHLNEYFKLADAYAKTLK